MSFGRAKIPRCTDNHPVAAREVKASEISKALGKTQKTDKWTPPRSTRNPPIIIRPVKPRSLSQPSTATAANKPKSPRPRSVGDEKNSPKLTKEAPGSKTIIDEQREAEDEEMLDFQSATVLAAGEDELPSEAKTFTEDANDESDRNSGGESDRKSTCNDIEVTRGGSVSGIPLRIKQAQTPAKATPNPSPRVTKTASRSSTVSSTHNRGSVSKASTGPEMKTAMSAERRTLETQFQTRKKRLELMKKELMVKQKLVKDSYHVLVQLKKKLEESGNTNVVLEELGLDEGKSLPPPGEPHRLEETTVVVPKQQEIDPEIVKNMKETVKDIPLSLFEICKQLVDKRMILLDTLVKTSENTIAPEDLQEHVKVYQEESVQLDKMLEDRFLLQDKHVEELVEKWQTLLQTSGDNAAVIDQIEQLQKKLSQAEQKYAAVWNDLQRVTQLNEQNEKKHHHADSVINDLREKIKHIELELNNEKALVQSQKEKANATEQKMKSLKTRVLEIETKFKESENRYNELQKTFKHTQEQVKANEHRWTKEKEDMLLKSKHDKQLLDKLTKERSFFEARVKTLEKSLEEEKKHKGHDKGLREELEKEKQAGAELQATVTSLQEKCEVLKNQLSVMETKSKQAMDIVKNMRTFEPSETDGITTDREAELYTELLATRVALKAAEEQIQNYNREKLRFIDSIQMLQGDPEKDQDSVAKTLIRNVENMTDLETRLANSDETICNQKIEIANLMAEIENLKQRTVIPAIQDENGANKDMELKSMLHEGKLKLEQSLKKSLDCEHKIIRYEHDLSKQSKQICEMENLLKVRDGLISMMKAKKDELQMENDSLNKYANEIRDLLIQAKEDARHRAELVQELTVNLESRGRLCQQLEKKIKELEGSLSATNEKRFKLQDTIGAMEKELQSTKAHIINMTPDVQTRYDTNKSNTYKRALPKRHPSFITCDVALHSLTNCNENIQQKNSSSTQNLTKACKYKPKSSSYPNTQLPQAQSNMVSQQHSHACVSCRETRSLACNFKHKPYCRFSGETAGPLINPYQHIQNIQSRLKFLKFAFKSLSKTIFHRDIMLKRVPATPLTTYEKEDPNVTTHLLPDQWPVATNNSKNKLQKSGTDIQELVSLNSLPSLNRKSSKSHLLAQNNNNDFENNPKSIAPKIGVSSSTPVCKIHGNCSKRLESLVSNNPLQDKINLNQRTTRSLSPSRTTSNHKTSNFRKGFNLTAHSTTNNSDKSESSNSCLVRSSSSTSFQTKALLKTSSSSSSSDLYYLCREADIKHLAPHNVHVKSTGKSQRSRPISAKLHRNDTHATSKLKLPSPDKHRRHRSEVRIKKRVTPTPTRSCVSTTSIEECCRFINHVQNISNYLEHKYNHGEASNAAKQYVPKLSSGNHRHKAKVKNSNPFEGCKSLADVEITTVLKKHEMIIDSLNKINADLTCSINLLSKNFRKTVSKT